MSAKSNIFIQHRIAIGFFVFIILYEFLLGTRCAFWSPPETVYPLYLLDFGFGFCSKLLPGAVFRFIFRTCSRSVIHVFCVFLFLCVIAGGAVLFEKLLLHVKNEYRSMCFISILLTITGPASITSFVRLLGYYDIYWLLIFILFFFLLSNKKLYFLVVLLFPLLVLVHYGAIICYIPAMLLILLYKTACTEDKNERLALWFVLLCSAVLAAGCVLYFVLYERNNLIYTLQEFVERLKERGARVTFVFETSFYGETLETAGAASNHGGAALLNDGSLFEAIKNMLADRFASAGGFTGHTASFRDTLFCLAVLLPVVAVIDCVLVRFIQSKETGLWKRLACVGSMLLFVFCMLIGYLFSTDTFRWFSNAFLPFMSFFLFVVFHDEDAVLFRFRAKQGVIPQPAVTVLIVLYVFCVPATL